MKSHAQTPFAHAFIARMKSGHTGMFMRDTSSSFPVTEYKSQSTAEMAGNDEVIEKVSDKAQRIVNENVEQAISRILNGYG